MKITLATIHCKSRFTPLALLYLKAHLVEASAYRFDDVTIREFPDDAWAEDVASEILAGQPDLIGLSCYVWNVKTLMAVSRRIKEVKPEIKIVLGGPEVGPLATEVLRTHPWRPLRRGHACPAPRRRGAIWAHCVGLAQPQLACARKPR